MKEEEQSDEMINEDHVKIFLVEPKMEMTEERCDVKDPIGIPGEKGRVGEEGRGEDLDRGVEEARSKLSEAKPVKRKRRGKNTKVNYIKDLRNENSNDPDVVDPNHSSRATKWKE